MAKPTRTNLSDLRGVARMAVDASTGIVDIVETMHRTVQRVPGPLGRKPTDRTRGITGLVYRTVRGSMQLVGTGLDRALAPLGQLLPEGESTPTRDAYLSAVNGVHGDYLARTGNPLALEMTLRHRGRQVEVTDLAGSLAAAGCPPITGRILLLVHGLCMSDLHWLRDGHDHGEALARELGLTPLYLRYNSGLSVAGNGLALSGLLESLLEAWPVRVQDLAIVGHSMGGLVARSALHHAVGSGRRWPSQLGRVVCLGTPHHGAPLERGGHGLDFLLDLSPYSAPFTRIGGQRSAGIKDLRHGNVTAGEHRFVQLPPDIRCYAIAGLLTTGRASAADRLVGDGLVPLDSALGRHKSVTRTLAVPPERQWVARGTGHLDLLGRAEVYRQLHRWFSEDLGN
jgi:pimeloyl-ACP methyl ester carboxylesterase